MIGASRLGLPARDVPYVASSLRLREEDVISRLPLAHDADGQGGEYCAVKWLVADVPALVLIAAFQERGTTLAYELVIRGGTVVDGTGLASYQADVAIEGDRIAKVGKIGSRGVREIDATGHVVNLA